MLSHMTAQVTILNAGITPFNASPRNFLDLTLMNLKGNEQVTLQAKLLTAQNELLVTVTSSPFTIKNGVNQTTGQGVTVASVNYSSSQKANAIKTTNTLPSGRYNYCVTITGVDVSDEYCQEMESESTSFLFLVSPPDKEEIDTKYPLLLWTHSESFSLLGSNEYFRIIVTELNGTQSPEAAINTNVPVYMKNLLQTHQVQYPIDAKELKPGNRYAWQVQKMNNGAIVNKTEAWEFKVKAPAQVKENKYAVMKKTLDGTMYLASGNKIFFRFDENYTGNKMRYKILNEKQEVVSLAKDDEENIKMESVNPGYNTYVIDLNSYKMPGGIYTLEIANEKKEVYKLKFTVE